MIPWAPLTEGALDMAQGIFSCVSQPWPQRAIAHELQAQQHPPVTALPPQQ